MSSAYFTDHDRRIIEDAIAAVITENEAAKLAKRYGFSGSFDLVQVVRSALGRIFRLDDETDSHLWELVSHTFITSPRAAVRRESPSFLALLRVVDERGLSLGNEGWMQLEDGELPDVPAHPRKVIIHDAAAGPDSPGQHFGASLVQVDVMSLLGERVGSEAVSQLLGSRVGPDVSSRLVGNVGSDLSSRLIGNVASDLTSQLASASTSWLGPGIAARLGIGGVSRSIGRHVFGYALSQMPFGANTASRVFNDFGQDIEITQEERTALRALDNKRTTTDEKQDQMTDDDTTTSVAAAMGLGLARVAGTVSGLHHADSSGPVAPEPVLPRQESQSARSAPEPAPESTPNRRSVAVIYGRDELARTAMFSYLRAAGLEPIEFQQIISQSGHGSPYTGDAIDGAFQRAQAIVAILTPDEVAQMHPDLNVDAARLQPRPNVIFELGLALGRAPSRTIIVVYGNVDLWSDVHGRHVVHMTDDAGRRSDLYRRLRDAGCDMSADTSDYLSASTGGGNFPTLNRTRTLPAS